MVTEVRPTATLDLDPVVVDRSEGYTGPAMLRVVAKLYHLAPNPKSHFSVTAEIGTARELARGDWQGGGAAHEIILKYFPELAPLVALHLSDEDGVPMHAEANASYWAGLTKWQEPDAAILAKHLRVPLAQANEIISVPADHRQKALDEDDAPPLEGRGRGGHRADGRAGLMLSGLTMTDILHLAEGEVPVRTYWATCQHYGYKEAESQEAAEAEALAHPTSIETLSYAERDAGVIPAGTGTVELRIVTKHEGGGIDTAILRYEVKRKRGGGRA